MQDSARTTSRASQSSATRTAPHHLLAELAQGLSDEGFTIPAEGSVYWVGEAMQGVDFKDKIPAPEAVATATKTLARNAAHLAIGAEREAENGKAPALNEESGAWPWCD